MSGVNSSKFINRYENNAQYVADASERAALGKSTVSLENNTGKLHYDGVNVVVSRPKVGDAVYVPSSCVYSAATPGSGVTEGTVTFIAGETLHTDSSNGYCPKGNPSLRPVGVVAAVHGKKVTVLYGSSVNSKPFYKTATTSSYVLPESTFTSDEWSTITVGDSIRDKAGRTGWRQAVSFDVLFAYLTKVGGENGSTGWSGGSNSDGKNNVFFTPYDWGLDYPCPDTNSNHSTYASDVAAAKDVYGSDLDGYKKYLQSRMIEYPTNYANLVNGVNNAKAATDIYIAYNESSGVATDFFPHAQWARNHHETYGSFGNFYNVLGLRREDWSEPSLLQFSEIFKNVKYALKDNDVYSDPINATLQRIGRSANTAALVTKSYWTPFVRSRSSNWHLSRYGFFHGTTYLYYVNWALSVALVNL